MAFQHQNPIAMASQQRSRRQAADPGPDHNHIVHKETFS
jgi:hypothetical protein